MRVRLATSADLPAILDIANWAAEHTIANFATEPETLEHWRSAFERTSELFPWVVAEESDQQALAGFAKAAPWAGRCAYHWAAEVTVYVHPEHHRRGVGPALYERLIATLRSQNYRILLAGVSVPNEPSVKLHSRMGFRRVARLERVGWKFNAWRDVEYWELLLDDDPEQPAPPQPIRPVREAWDDCP